MAEEQNTGFSGIFQDPNFITGMAVLGANADPNRHWSEGYKDASGILSNMQRSALARAELELRKQKMQQEQAQIEAARERAAKMREALNAAETPEDYARAMILHGEDGQVSSGMQALTALLKKPPSMSLEEQAFADYQAQNPNATYIDFRRDLEATKQAGKVGGAPKVATGEGGIRYYINSQTGEPLQDPMGNLILAPGGVGEEIAGEKAKREFAWPEVQRGYEARISDLGQSRDAIEEVRRVLDSPSFLPKTGPGSLFSKIPGTAANDLRNKIDTVKARIGFDELQRMRDNSPTGGALGQVTERELGLLQSVLASLEQSQTKEEFQTNLDAVERQIALSQANIRAALEEDAARFGGQAAPAPQGSSDIDTLLNKYGVK